MDAFGSVSLAKLACSQTPLAAAIASKDKGLTAKRSMPLSTCQLPGSLAAYPVAAVAWPSQSASRADHRAAQVADARCGTPCSSPATLCCSFRTTL
jgi:hypothetical protein